VKPSTRCTKPMKKPIEYYVFKRVLVAYITIGVFKIVIDWHTDLDSWTPFLFLLLGLWTTEQIFKINKTKNNGGITNWREFIAVLKESYPMREKPEYLDLPCEGCHEETRHVVKASINEQEAYDYEMTCSQCGNTEHK